MRSRACTSTGSSRISRRYRAQHVLAALGFTATSYWVISGYDVLALRYLRKRLPYGRILFTCFIA